mmetsp:Transcript_5125/g.14747  ORF Transcript_5125/g.14747 Transcript_5125/m.14747 type:complete len:107 (+) Transcript_5125:1372-1692(+)
MRVSCGGLHLEDTLLDGEERYVEGSTTEIKDEHVLLLALLVQTVRDRRRGGLVDNPEHIEARNRTSILCCLTLGVVEISGYSDDRILNLFSEVRLCNFLHLPKNHR